MSLGLMPRDEIEDLLVENGDFLVRKVSLQSLISLLKQGPISDRGPEASALRRLCHERASHPTHPDQLQERRVVLEGGEYRSSFAHQRIQL